MSKGVRYTGVPSAEEFAACPGVPDQKRMEAGRIAVLECVQEIPCNPCEAACPFGAITVGEPITRLPVLDCDKCTGCGTCVAACPGLAIFMVNHAYSDTEGTVDFPYEYWPLPQKGDRVDAVGRDGAVLCKGTVVAVKQPASFDATAVITLAVPKALVDDVRGMKRL